MKPGYQVKELITNLLFLICCNSFNGFEDILQFHKYENYKKSTPRYNSPQRCMPCRNPEPYCLQSLPTRSVKRKCQPGQPMYQVFHYNMQNPVTYTILGASQAKGTPVVHKINQDWNRRFDQTKKKAETRTRGSLQKIKPDNTYSNLLVVHYRSSYPQQSIKVYDILLFLY